MECSKFFFNRSSGQGFLRGIAAGLSKPSGKGDTDRPGKKYNEPTAIIKPVPFKIGQDLAVSINGGKSLLVNKYFHIALCLCGLSVVSLGITIFCLPFDVYKDRS
jgi:hypothetical protein